MAGEQASYGDGQGMQITPRGLALARTVDSTISTSTEITLQPTTKYLRLYATSQDVYLRWGIEDCNENTFDEIIPAGQVVDLMVPDDIRGVRSTAINVIERASGATIVVIEK